MTKADDLLALVYPHEFLGRCQTCQDNAYLSSEPCALAGSVGYLNGHPFNDSECRIRLGRKEHDHALAAEKV